MIVDRLDALSAISFIEPAIPKETKTGKSCLFIRVEADKLILTGGGQFVTKKAVLIRPNTTEESARSEKKYVSPPIFMVPLADLLGFKEMMKGHKADCKRMSKDDPSYLFVEIDETELISHDGKVVYQQPKHEFKDLETCFQVNMEAVSGMEVMSADVLAAMTGFKKSKPVEITFTGYKKPIHFLQGDYEAILIPPVEREDDGNEQTEIDE